MKNVILGLLLIAGFIEANEIWTCIDIISKQKKLVFSVDRNVLIAMTEDRQYHKLPFQKEVKIPKNKETKNLGDKVSIYSNDTYTLNVFYGLSFSPSNNIIGVNLIYKEYVYPTYLCQSHEQ